jgi:hypothetical protein
VGPEARTKSALEARIRLFRELELRVASEPKAPVAWLAAIRDLIMEAEAERNPALNP